VTIDSRPLPGLGTQSDTVSGQLVFVGRDTVRGTMASKGHVVPGQPTLDATTMNVYLATKSDSLLILRSATTGAVDTAFTTVHVVTLIAHMVGSPGRQIRTYVQ
jgi:hypothetical protein